ncbi:MAG: hypothetical protein ACOX8S_04195 [Christensenellales bacterium]|jgi:hypothetical protein
MSNRKQNEGRGQNDQRPRIWLVIIFGIILFFGTGLATNYFNEDVDMVNVQEKMFYYISGEDADAHLLTLAYCVGIALGVLAFFNPLMIGKKNGKPTPMETKYFEYEDKAQQMLQREAQELKEMKEKGKAAGSGK